MLVVVGTGLLVPEGEPLEEDVEPMALALKASKVFPLEGALIANTIPLPQWPLWAQYTQTGVVSFTLTVKVGKVAASVPTGSNPELKPFIMGLQGLAKVDWVAVWFFGWNSKVTVSPGRAATVFGWNVRVPLLPTVTRWSEPVEVGKGLPVEVEVGGVDMEAGGTEELPIAFALKVLKLLPGFTAKTIPCWQ